MDVKETWCEVVDWIRVVEGRSSGRLLRTW